jgi:hypothetical protein
MRSRFRLTLPLLFLVATMAGCTSRAASPGGGLPGATQVTPLAAGGPGAAAFILPEGPELASVALSDAPSYLFLFTHTEDPFNHELSEERYWRVGAMVAAIATAYPELDMTWTIEFQGSDAATVYARNPETGVVDYLRSLRDRGLVEFGYHAHHDPTYENRPQNELGNEPSYDEAYEALWTWITCVKDTAYGGCVEERGGGIEAVLEAFGQVKIVTGLGLDGGAQMERSAGSQAVRDLLPGRLLGFGFPDHGSVTRDRTYIEARDGLLGLLTPTHETSSATFWMDNAIRINDSASLEGVNGGPLRDGPELIAAAMDAVDGTRSFVINVGVADKYHYTVESTSPTKYGYEHPESPELPAELLRTPQQRERSYALTEQALNYLAERISADPAAFRFVSADEVVALFTSEDYWNVDDDELEQIALWILNEWHAEPPDWVYDGEDFYSLADAFALLAAALRDAPATGIVSNVYGPWSAVAAETDSIDLPIAALQTLRGGELVNGSRIAETYTVDGRTLSATQVLYALAYLFVLERNGVEAESIHIPETRSAPQTSGYLEALGCSNCLDTAWSLKPARFQDPE